MHALGYTDDIVILVSEVTSQYYISATVNALEYCVKRNLKLSLCKSKILIFRKGDKMASEEKWRWVKERIGSVPPYKYLGVTVSTKLSFKQYIAEGMTKPKAGLSLVWNIVICNKEITFTSKVHVFNRVNRATLCSGAQVWGGQQHDDVENLMRFFLKKLYCLPMCTQIKRN